MGHVLIAKASRWCLSDDRTGAPSFHHSLMTRGSQFPRVSSMERLYAISGKDRYSCTNRKKRLPIDELLDSYEEELRRKYPEWANLQVSVGAGARFKSL